VSTPKNLNELSKQKKVFNFISHLSLSSENINVIKSFKLYCWYIDIKLQTKRYHYQNIVKCYQSEIKG